MGRCVLLSTLQGSGCLICLASSVDWGARDFSTSIVYIEAYASMKLYKSFSVCNLEP